MTTAALLKRAASIKPPAAPGPVRDGADMLLDQVQALLIEAGIGRPHESIYDADAMAGWLHRCCEGAADARDLELFERACAMPAPAPDVSAEAYLRATARFMRAIF